MVLPASTAGRIATLLILLYIVALNPPVLTAVDDAAPLMGVGPLYLWFVGWGIFGCIVLVWAAYRDAFGLSEADIPPEIAGGREQSQKVDASDRRERD